MRTTKQKTFLVSILAVFTLIIAALAGAFMPERAKAMTMERFGYAGMKYQMAQIAPQNNAFQDNRKGLHMYAYESGATAELKGAFYGQFDAEVKASSKDSVKPDLLAYSFLFESLTGEEAFRLTVQDSGTETNAFVEVKGEKAGIFYNVDQSWDGKAHGYTTVENEIGVYTRILTTGTTSVHFDPFTMEISMKNQKGESITVWNLSNEVMDGKRFPYVIEEMSQYTVTIEFTTVKSGGKGELTVYSINGEDYGKVDLPQAAPLLYTEGVENAVKDSAWTLPTLGVYDYAGEITAEDVSYEIYNEQGDKLAQGAYGKDVTFTPTAVGEYFLYYSVEKNGAKGEAYLRFKAYDAENVSYIFEDISLQSQTAGVKASVYIPTRTMESNLLPDGATLNANVTVKKDGAILSGYENVAAGFYFTFEEAGQYEIIYNGKVSGSVYEATPIVVEASDDVVGVQMEDLLDSYAYGESITLPKATVYVYGKSGEATPTVILPSGEQISGEEISLDAIGTYEVCYAYSVGSATGTFSRYFTVEYELEDLFVLGEKTTVVYDDTVGNADMDGALVTLGSSNSSITYDVDLSDNTKHDILMEAIVIPSTLGAHDMTGFYVTLTDKLNPDNFLTIRMNEGSGNAITATFIRAKASNQPGFVGWYKQPDWNTTPMEYTDQLETTMSHVYGGFLSGLNFGLDSITKDLSKHTLVLKYDTEEKALYSTSDYNYKTDSELLYQRVVDFDDPACFNNLWSGFTDNSQVELTITPLGLSGSAQMKIFEIDGNSFSQNRVTDTTAPSAEIDLMGMESAPKAKTGANYPIFDLLVKDDFCSVDSIKTSVSVKYGNEDVPVVNGGFIPTQDGFYTIEYIVEDAYGNDSKTSISVQAVSDISEVSAILDGTWADEMHYGTEFTFPTYHGEGGSGAYTYSAIVTCNGNEVEVNEGSVLPLGVGKYEITLVVSDYLGQTATLQKEYDVAFSTDMIIDENDIVLPLLFIDGSAFVFEEYVAEYYQAAGGEVAYATAKIEVEDANGVTALGADRKYTPKASDSVTEAKIRFIFAGTAAGNKVEKTVEKVVPIRVAPQKSGFLGEYFVTENATVTPRNQYMTFETVEAKDMKATFVRAVSTDEFMLQFKPLEKEDKIYSAFEALVVTLTDKNDKDIAVRFTVRKNGDSLTFSLNGESSIPMFGSLSAVSSQNVQISYDNNTFAVTGVENSSLGRVEKTISGKAFAGFPSKEVYVEFALVGVTENCGINLVTINNQRFFNGAKDTTVPQLYVDGSYSGMYTTGAQVTIPTARAYDVLSYCSPVTVTVKDEDGNFITAEDGTVLNEALANKEYVVTLTKINRYNVLYKATDAANQSKTSSKDILIYDNVLPTLTLDKELPSLVWTGTKVEIPTFTISDNGDISKVEVEAYYSNCNSGLTKITNNTFVADEAGQYTVYFYLIDENDVRNAVSFTFTAVEKA